MTRIAKPFAVAALLAALGTGTPPEALSSVPVGAPVFSSPTTFTHPLFPFQVGGVRVFAGKSEGAKTIVIDSFLSDTRNFTWGGGTVTCRVMRETEFEDGALVEISTNYFAQADDGSVYYFGEVVDNYEDGVVADHGGSWLVGGAGGGDPPGVQATADPALFLPASPEVGDEFMPENVPDGPQELDRVMKVGVRIKTAAGTFEDGIEVLETDVADGATERKWYAPGIGVCRGKASGEAFALVATTLAPADE